VADTNNHAIRVIDLRTHQVSTFRLKDIERLPAPNPRRVLLAAQTVRPGDVTVEVSLDLPPNYHLNEHLNEAAPARITVSQDGMAQSVSVTAFPARVPFRAPESNSNIAVEASVYYCREGRDAVCLYHQVKMELPLHKDPQGKDAVEIRVTPPG
jgi:hypothetical protein